MIDVLIIDPFRYWLGVAFVGGAGFVAGLLAMWCWLTWTPPDLDS